MIVRNVENWSARKYVLATEYGGVLGRREWPPAVKIVCMPRHECLTPLLTRAGFPRRVQQFVRPALSRCEAHDALISEITVAILKF